MRHTMLQGDWSSDVCSSDLSCEAPKRGRGRRGRRRGRRGRREEREERGRREEREEGKKGRSGSAGSNSLRSSLRSEERRVGKECRPGGPKEERKKRR